MIRIRALLNVNHFSFITFPVDFFQNYREVEKLKLLIVLTIKIYVRLYRNFFFTHNSWL